MVTFGNKNGSFLVLFKDDSRKEVFMIYRTDYPVWVLTGGGIEVGETPEKAAIRETVEETGFETKVVRLVGEYRYPEKNICVFEGRYVSGSYKPEFEGNIGKWFLVDHLPPDITSSTRRMMLDVFADDNGPFIKEVKDELPLIENLVIVFRHPFEFLKFVKRTFCKF